MNGSCTCLKNTRHLVFANGDKTHTEEIPSADRLLRVQGLAMKNTQGELKYKTLIQVMQTGLTLSHGNTDVEQSFSANKKSVTAERAALSIYTIIRMKASSCQTSQHNT